MTFYPSITFHLSLIFFTCQVSAFELQPFSCHDLANAKYSQTAKAVFIHLKPLGKWEGKAMGMKLVALDEVGGVNIQEIGNKKET